MFVARQLRHISPATTLTVYAHLFDSAANIGGVGGTGLRTSSATPLLCADRRSLSRLRLVQVHDPVCDLLAGEGLACRDERTDAGWAT